MDEVFNDGIFKITKNNEEKRHIFTIYAINSYPGGDKHFISNFLKISSREYEELMDLLNVNAHYVTTDFGFVMELTTFIKEEDALKAVEYLEGLLVCNKLKGEI